MKFPRYPISDPDAHTQAPTPGFPEHWQRSLCFQTDRFSAYFVSPDQFRSLAPWVGAVRSLTYRQLSPYSSHTIDLDGRDAHYWHLLVWDRQDDALAGSLRMALSGWHPDGRDGNHSYLEHAFPGLDRHIRGHQFPYAEIGRTFVASPYQRTSLVLMVLLQAMASIPLATGHQHVFGLVSYNQFAHSDLLNRHFLAALLAPPFRDHLSAPPPRYPITGLPDCRDVQPASTLLDLEHQLRERYQEPFQVPVLLRRYHKFGNARVMGLSLAKDFNLITEILMHCDLQQLSPRQQRIFVVEPLIPVWDEVVSPGDVHC